MRRTEKETSKPVGRSLDVRVTAGAGEDRVVGRFGDVFRIKIGAPPQEGRANAALLRYLAELLRISRSSLGIVRGEHAREKRIWIDGTGAEEAVKRLIEICEKLKSNVRRR